MKIAGKNVLLTGASGGLGEAIAKELAGRGARLTLTARRVGELTQLAEAVGGEVLVADLAEQGDLDRVIEAGNDVDILIANAGMGQDSPISELTSAEIDLAIAVNLRAPILMATEFVQAHLDSGKPGHIVFIGSLSGIVTSPDTRMYNATKFGLRGFALSLRQDLLGSNMGVSLVAPGFIRDAGMFAESGMKLPSGVRTKTPDDVARGVAKAIESNAAELFVAPLELRLGATLGSVAPTLSARIQGLAGAADIKSGRVVHE
ncbi:MAG TPA: SDR family NAD(P)-dependent oxidoreductase [Microthrixaceae bacterium]|nr:SDR family NAD(P)-dependent oxidoreductase [Microthrixaceae bacterium]